MNESKIFTNFQSYFGELKEFRQQAKIKHLMSDILFIVVLATICGASDFEEIALFAQSRREWLSSFLKLPGGIPSHDTINRVMCAIDPVGFEQAFMDWISCYKDQLQAPSLEQEQEIAKDVIAMDGKTIRNSSDTTKGIRAAHMVSAYSTKFGLVLGQKKCHEKSNEITAIPALLALIDLKGVIITIDAMGTQKNIATTIIDKGADYILALKGNQGNLQTEVVDFFDKVKNPEFQRYIYQKDQEIDKGHGRIETRICQTITNLDWLYETSKWKGIKSIIKVTSIVISEDKETSEDRYYISSLNGNAKLINRSIRKHWQIENNLHWVLDVLFREDYCRIRSGNGAENMSIIRKIALAIIKSDSSTKKSLKSKRQKAAWDQQYALYIMSQMMR